MAEIDCLTRIISVLRVNNPGKLGYNTEKVRNKYKAFAILIELSEFIYQP